MAIQESLGLPETHVSMTFGADGTKQISGHPEAVAQAMAHLEQLQGDHPSAQGTEYRAADFRHLAVKKFITRNLGALTFMGVVFAGSTAAYSVASQENLVKHPADFSQPIHQAREMAHLALHVGEDVL